MVGRVDDLLFDSATWTVRYLVVDTNGWRPGGKVLLEPHTIDRVSGSEAKLFVHEERAVVKTHPPYIPDEALHTDYLAGRPSPQPPIMSERRPPTGSPRDPPPTAQENF